MVKSIQLRKLRRLARSSFFSEKAIFYVNIQKIASPPACCCQTTRTLEIQWLHPGANCINAAQSFNYRV